jgi:hypothetical protein
MSKDKSGDFRRLAGSRTRATLDMIRKLENLSNRTNYNYDDAQVDKIFEALEEALRVAKAKFQKPTSRRFDL